MYNLYLVQVADKYGPNKFLPLAVSYQWLYAQTDNWVKENWQVSGVVIEKIPVKQLVQTFKNPNLVALSCYVWNWEYNKSLAKLIKSIYPDCTIVVGGPQVSKHDLDFFKKYPYFDLAVLGEGELAFKEILLKYPLGDYSGIPHTFSKKSLLSTAQPKRLLELNNIPSPILSGFYDSIIQSYEDKNIKWQVTYETLRGCPYQCTFCDIGEDYWNKITKFDIDRIEQEIDWMGTNKIEYVTVCDSNWGLLPRDKDITEYVIKTKLKHGYPKFWDVTWAKNNPDRIYEIALADKQANTRLFKGITFAMQSLNPSTLSATKRFNIDSNTSQTYLIEYQKSDISTYSELIWPMPCETVESLKNNIQQLIDLNQKDFLMVHPLVITKNAPMADLNYVKQHQLKYKKVPLDIFWLAIEDQDSYIVEEVNAVYETNSVDFEGMIKGHIFAHWLIVFYYYGWAHYIIEYISKTKKVNQTTVVAQIIDWVERNPNTILHKQHQEVEQGLRGVFDSGNFWGIKIDDTYWEYKSAVCVFFNKHRNIVYDNLRNFLEQEYPDIEVSIVDFNRNMCVDRLVAYPIKIEVPKSIAKVLFDSNTGTAEIDHWDKSKMSESEFIRVAYHYQRKNRYWRCNIKFC